jgi:hypothetical protein
VWQRFVQILCFGFKTRSFCLNWDSCLIGWQASIKLPAGMTLLRSGWAVTQKINKKSDHKKIPAMAGISFAVMTPYRRHRGGAPPAS